MVKHAQIVVLPQGMELSTQMVRSGFNIDFICLLMPQVEQNGTVSFEVISAKLGELNLPTFLVMPLVSYIFSRDLGVWDIRLGDNIRISSIALFDKSLNVILSPIKQTESP